MRVLPHNTEAEKWILGAIILDNDGMEVAVELLTPEDFYTEKHRLIFGAMVALFDEGQAIDPVSLAERLMLGRNLDRIGGTGYLSTLMDGLPRALNVWLGHGVAPAGVGYWSNSVEVYARVVKDKAALRKLIVSANAIIAAAIKGDQESDEIIAQAERDIAEVGGSDR